MDVTPDLVCDGGRLPYYMKECGELWVYLGVRTCDIFLCFGTIVFLLYLCFASSLLYCSFFVLRHR